VPDEYSAQKVRPMPYSHSKQADLEFCCSAIIKNNLSQNDYSGQGQSWGFVLVDNEIDFHFSVRPRGFKLTVHFCGNVIQIKGNIRILNIHVKTGGARGQERLGFADKLELIAVDSGGKLWFDVVGEIIFDIGDERYREIQFPDRMIGFLRSVMKINIAVDDLNVIQREQKRLFLFGRFRLLLFLGEQVGKIVRAIGPAGNADIRIGQGNFFIISARR